MEKEINFNDLNIEEKACFNILQSIVKKRHLSYGYSDDKICISKVADEWLTYIVDKGEIFNLKKYRGMFSASTAILYEIAENSDEYNKLFNEFYIKLCESNISIINESCNNMDYIVPMIPPQSKKPPIPDEEIEKFAHDITKLAQKDGMSVTYEEAEEFVRSMFSFSNIEMNNSKKR